MGSHWFAVVMAGGAGTRFWPASRKLRPKQLLALGPHPDEALLQATVRRLQAVVPLERVYIATGIHLVDATRKALPDLPGENILAEPTPRNTAPCIAWATAVIQRRDPHAVIGVLSADHVATDEQGFRQALLRAMRVAEQGVITTIGIVPSRPETGYGYIELGAERSDGARVAARFIEKPNSDNAARMVDSGRFLWNAGFFFFTASRMRQALAEHLPGLAQTVDDFDQAAAQGREPQKLAEVFPLLEAVSIDVGLMEKVSPLAVVPADFGWSDVGSWQTAWELAPQDANQNVAPQDAILVESRGNMVADWGPPGSPRKVVALLGVQNMVVVQTGDALLVMPRDRSQDVRKIVSALVGAGHADKL
ncbi:MAG: sugar phosphate nucleotidyltransferase [Polyangiaceae bacterium]|jgi:mannose-1-phosphate guanylyltransferase|nr:sugar phosphate nucleotidyltransferase [Polyangiaceae bacterium]